MNFQRVLLFILLSPWISTAGATPDMTVAPSKQVPKKSLSELIDELADDSYKAREQATHAIWKLGESALPDLELAENAGDPEQAYRARELIRKIRFRITPETDPSVIALVEHYHKASTDERIGVMEQLHRKRAWYQALKLFASESDLEVRSRVEPGMKDMSVIAARESLMSGDNNGAREFLEMVPADASGLIPLAAFHGTQGTLDSELERAKTLKGPARSAWQLALNRVKGDLVAARQAATDAGELKLSATMAALSGDPLPWLRLGGAADAETGEIPIYPPYTELAIRRWQGKPLNAIELEGLTRSLQSTEHDERDLGINSLFLLGESPLAEKAFAKTNPLVAFDFFLAMERIPEALSALGIDPKNPDYSGWVEKRIHSILKLQIDDQHQDSNPLPELLALAYFFDSRGVYKTDPDVFGKPLAFMAGKEPEQFLKLLGRLFSQSTVDSLSGKAPEIAWKAASAWAGESVERWDDVVDTALGGRDEIQVLWNWIGELQPTLKPSERFEIMLIICGLKVDPEQLREKWLNLAWDVIEKTPKENHLQLLERMMFAVAWNPDSATSLKLWEMLPESNRNEFSWGAHIYDLSAEERWEEAAEFFLGQIERIAKNNGTPEPRYHASAAACLRRAGKPEEAAIHDSLVDKLALGRDSLEIATGYAFGYDYGLAAIWWKKATELLDPTSDEFPVALRLHSEALLALGQWEKLASIAEISVQMYAITQPQPINSTHAMRNRIHADLGRGLAKLKTDRDQAIAILDRCRKICPNEGAMSDSFYPSLRKSGLMREHDEWFDEAWSGITAVIERFPNCESTYNSAGWMAARAQRNLDQAEGFLEIALKKNPSQAAYLDTMGEIQFARGKRQKAIEWSAKAVNFSPTDPMLRRQHERFKNDPLPR